MCNFMQGAAPGDWDWGDGLWGVGEGLTKPCGSHHHTNLKLKHTIYPTQSTLLVSCHTVCVTHVTHCVSCTAPLALVLVSAGVGGKTLLEALLSHPTRPAGMGGSQPAGTGPARGHRCVLWLLANAVMIVTLTAIPTSQYSDLVAADYGIAIAVVAKTLHLVFSSAI